MSGSSYSLLTKEDTSDEETEDHFVHKTGRHVKKRKARYHVRDLLLVVTGFIFAFAVLKALNWYEIEDNFYHDLLELDEFHNDKLNYKSHNSNNGSLAHLLFQKVRVLCIVTTTPENHKRRAIHVKRTWGKRCNKLIFASTLQDEKLGSVAFDVDPSRKGLWDKTKESFKYAYKNHLEEFDWLLKADDDTFVILENLRYFLYPYSPQFPIAFGCKLHLDDDDSYFSGGASYVLSKKTLTKLVEEGFTNPKICNPKPVEDEDVEIGYCLNRLNITAGDSRDEFKRGRFHPLSPASTLLPFAKIDDWYLDAIYYKFQIGLNCCSDYSISFHYIEPKELYAMEYLLYHMKKPFGVPETISVLPKKLTWNETLERNRVDLSETTD